MIFARLGDKRQTRRQNIAEIVFSWGMSEIKCIIFKENNDNPYENYNNYIKLRVRASHMFQSFHLCFTAHSYIDALVLLGRICDVVENDEALAF